MLDTLQLEPFAKLDKDLKVAALTLTPNEARYLVEILRQRSVVQGDGCWAWTGARTKAGYGQIQKRRFFGPVPMYTHRLAYSLLVGEITDGLHVLHRCDNPACWRPGHLFLGTNQDNTDDKIQKGRLRHGHLYGDMHPARRDGSFLKRGEYHPAARLSWEDVRAIRTRYAMGGITQDELGHAYGVARTTISHIITGRLWQEDTHD